MKTQGIQSTFEMFLDLNISQFLSTETIKCSWTSSVYIDVSCAHFLFCVLEKIVLAMLQLPKKVVLSHFSECFFSCTTDSVLFNYDFKDSLSSGISITMRRGSTISTFFRKLCFKYCFTIESQFIQYLKGLFFETAQLILCLQFLDA